MKLRSPRLLVWALLPLALAARAGAQVERYELQGLGTIFRYGARLAVLGDVDLDGVADWASADPDYNGFYTDSGRVWIHSGADGTEIERLNGIGDDDRLGDVVIGLDDVDGDGHADLAVVGHHRGFRVDVYSGIGGVVLFSVGPPLGASAWGTGLFRLDDVSGDSRADFAVTEPGDGVRPDRVWVHSGDSGTDLYALEAPGGASLAQFGFSVASAGDLDGDGLAEVLVGAPLFCATCAGAIEGGVFVFRGADGSLLRSHHGDGAAEELGARVAGLGDVDGDGIADYAAQAGAPNDVVRLFSGVDGALLHEYAFAGGAGGAGLGLVALADLDGDGAGELGVLPRVLGHEPYALVSSTRPPYGELERIPGRFTGGDGQWLLASPGDLTGDGTPDLLFGEPSFLDHFAPDFPDQMHVGRVVAVALDERSVDAQRECTPTDNSTGLEARIWYHGSLALGDGTLELLAWNLPPDQSCLVFHGPNAIEVPFGNGLRCAGGGVTRLAPVGSGPDGIVELPLPAARAPAPGVTSRFQAWFRDPAGGGAGFDLSDAAALTLAP